ncbi:MAG: GNAT family N-acetyltransferase [Oxalobacteraceae bacterium]
MSAEFSSDSEAASRCQSEFFTAPVPDTLWPLLESLYSSVYSSRALLQPHGGSGLLDSTAHAWMEHTGGRVSALLLFTCEGPRVRVLNEVLSLPDAVIRRFTDAIFARYRQIHLVQFHAIALAVQPDRSWFWFSVFSEDYVLDLPDSHAAWLDSLSRQAREKARYYLKRSFRRQPSLEFTVSCGATIVDAEVMAVLRLNRQRMQRKGKTYAMSDAEASQLTRLMPQVGMLFALRLEGEICAGLLCSAIGKDIYLHVIAHDPAHDDLRLGLVCCCLAIQQAIECQFSRFHFLWGHYDYKRRLGGHSRPLYRVLIARRSWHLLAHPVHGMRWCAQLARDTARRWRRPAVAREPRC